MSDARERSRRAAEDLRSVGADEKDAILVEIEKEIAACDTQLRATLERRHQLELERALVKQASVVEIIRAAEEIVAEDSSVPSLDARTDPTGRKTRILALLSSGEKSPQQIHAAFA